MPENGSLPDGFNLSAFQDPGSRYKLGEILGTGVYGEVYEATDSESNGKRVAIKIQPVTPDTEEDLANEYNILRKLSNHTNLPDLYGVYLKIASSRSEDDKIWFVMELCEGGPITDLVRGLQEMNRRMSEEHIAYILREIVKVLVYLHENNVMHRDVKGSNILLTREGEIKLVDYGLSRELKNNLDKRGTYVGSPCWMAPEMIEAFKEEKEYDSRIDVWALGITAIELGDGKAPFLDIHPTRALFQIVRNPPPTLYRPANWTQLYNDFISECLEKNPEHRPFVEELLEHPFLTGLPENDFHLSTELKLLIQDFGSKGRPSRKTEFAVRNGFLKTGLSPKMELMHREDLAALDKPNEDVIAQELHERLKQGNFYSFLGDVLLALNPNSEHSIYTNEMHVKYQFKARSDNPPHIYSVADRAYQDVMHHEEPQHILLAGETLSGKTTNMMHLLSHLLYLGLSPNKVGPNVDKASKVVQALGNAATPFNPNSTRHVLQLEVCYTSTGKVSGAVFWLYQLEKWRVTTAIRSQANFHIFYYFYDAMEAMGRLKQYNLDGGRKYRYLRTQPTEGSSENSHGPREDPGGNVEKFKELESNLRDIGFQDDQLDTLCNLIAAVLLLGEIKFKQGPANEAELETPDPAVKVAHLLSVDEKKFSWALVNYCVIEKGTAVRRRHTKQEAEEARDVLARAIYARTVDWLVNVINHKMSFTRAVFGHKYSVTIMDMFGFECYKKNRLEQLFVNTLNEQLQYHYNQRVFAWEMQEQEDEEIPVQTLQYYDNKPTVDELMAKPDGLLYMLDEASRMGQGCKFIMDSLENKGKGTRLKVVGDHEFTVAHYTGKVTYDTRDMADKNRDFLPPEMIDTLRLSSDKMVKLLFTNQMSKTGNLTMSAEECGVILDKTKRKWGAALMAETDNNAKRLQPENQGQFSQTRQMRTASTIYRSTSLEILRGLAVGPSSGGTHFVRCLRADLTGQPKGFQPDVVRQQLRALAVVDTAHARQIGFPHRVPFPEFIRRYKFLAFDFDENVEVTKDNSRLLLVRLKMEGWVIGKSKVFLKYYNEEYLARAYEIQVKKIVKVQTMMRAFLAKRSVASRLLKFRKSSSVDIIDEKNTKTRKSSVKKSSELSEEDASLIIQKQYRGYRVRKEMGPISRCKLNVNTVEFIKDYWRRWKAKTIFQVLLMYRATRQQDLVYFSQQVHLYNQAAMSGLSRCNKDIQSLDKIECGARATLVLGKKHPSVWKKPFNFKDDLPYFDTTFLNDPMTSGIGPAASIEEEMEAWDAPLRRGNSVPWRIHKVQMRDKEVQTGTESSPDYDEEELHENYIQRPFCRDPRLAALQRSPQKTASSQYVSEQRPIQAYSYQNKKSEVYNPGKAKKMEQRQEFDNRSREWENNNILQSTTPQYIPRPTSPLPTYNRFPCSNYNKNADNSWQNKNQYNKPSSGGYQAQKRGGRGSNNPIAEMELRGKRHDDITENDDPPFNFQAMLRKTNTNRASLKRVKENQPQSPIKETYRQNYNNSTANDKSDSRASSVIYNSNDRSKYSSPTPGVGSKNSWNGNEPKKPLNNNEQQWSTNQPKGWNNNNQWEKSDSNKSSNDNDDWKEPRAITPWNEKTEFCRYAASPKSRGEKDRFDSKPWNESDHDLRSPSSKSSGRVQRTDSSKSMKRKAPQPPSKTNSGFLTYSPEPTTMELAPGIIIEGLVADL